MNQIELYKMLLQVEHPRRVTHERVYATGKEKKMIYDTTRGGYIIKRRVVKGGSPIVIDLADQIDLLHY